jgi:hypothetical protein
MFSPGAGRARAACRSAIFGRGKIVGGFLAVHGIIVRRLAEMEESEIFIRNSTEVVERVVVFSNVEANGIASQPSNALRNEVRIILAAQ